MNFADKVVWVTGNVSGMGKSTTFEFAKRGAKVVVHGYNNHDLAIEMFNELKAINPNVILVEGNITNKADVDQIVEKIKQEYGRIDILVNNVGGVVARKGIEELDENEWDEVINLNLKSVYLGTQAALPLMKEYGGKIINIVSNVERHGGAPEEFAYTTSKGGVAALTRALAKDLVKYKILVNGVAPGIVNTPFLEGIKEETFKSIVEKIPVKRVGEPIDIANAVLFLASPMSDFIVGEIIEASGGRRLS